MITEEILKQNGFEAQTFFYEIGGGEDEDDTTIFVRGDVVAFWDQWRKCWKKTNYSWLTYVNGLPDDAEEFTVEDL